MVIGVVLSIHEDGLMEPRISIIVVQWLCLSFGFSPVSDGSIGIEMNWWKPRDASGPAQSDHF